MTNSHTFTLESLSAQWVTALTPQLTAHMVYDSLNEPRYAIRIILDNGTANERALAMISGRNMTDTLRNAENWLLQALGAEIVLRQPPLAAEENCK